MKDIDLIPDMLIGKLPHLSVSKAVQYLNFLTSVAERMTPVRDEDDSGVPSAFGRRQNQLQQGGVPVRQLQLMMPGRGTIPFSQTRNLTARRVGCRV